MRGPDLPAAVVPLVEAWINGARVILGGNLVSIRLHGSVALGDFAPGWSDVDVCGVVDDDPGEAALSGLSSLQSGLYDRFVRGGESGWRSTQAVEALLLTPEVLAGGPGPVVDIGSERGEVRLLPGLPAFDRLTDSRFGRTLEGEELAVSPPTREALRASLADDLAVVRAGGSGTPIWHAGILGWMARSLSFWTRDELTGKTAALEREQERGPPLSDGFRLAAAMRREGSRACAGHRGELEIAFRDCAPVVIGMLRKYCAPA